MPLLPKQLNFYFIAAFLSVQLLCCLPSFAQSFDKDYSPIRSFKAEEILFTSIYKTYDSIGSNYTFDDKKIKKTFQRSIDASKERLKSLDSAGYLMKNDEITKYLQSLVDRIKNSNQALANKKLIVFTYRTDVPNASNRSAGVILFNLDLLTKLETEEEVAFILCHEISHDILGHVMKGLLKQTDMENDPNYKKELEKIKNQEFNKLPAYEKLVAKYLTEYTGQRRRHETQADSMGLRLFMNSGYDPSFALKVIAKLDSVDQMNFKDSVNYSKFFSFTDYPFKKSWLDEEQEESIGGNIDASFDLPDSLKTHPDCKKRVEALKLLIPADFKNSIANFIGNFESIRTISQFELIEHLQQDYYFSNALYQVISMLERYPENKYLHASLVNCLLEITKAQKEHYFSSVVDFPTKNFGESYHRMLVFLHNSNSEILKNIYARYFNTHTNLINGMYRDYIVTLVDGIDKTAEERTSLVTVFKEKYKETYYSKLLEEKLKVKPKTK